jgi:RND family efflux transporter MFP subunit
LERSQKRLQTVNDKLEKTKVLSPMSGVVLELPVVQGQVVVGAASVNSGTLLMKVADLKRLLISTHVNQVDVARLKAGMPIRFTVDSLPGKEMEGRIDNIAPTATIVKNIKGFTVEMLIENPDPALRPGMTADLVIPIEKAEDVLSVPLAAVFSEPDGSKICFVEKTDPDGTTTAEKRPVKIGLSDTDHVQILSGLQENEPILLVRPEASPAGKRS